jgi:hypothetical protein
LADLGQQPEVGLPALDLAWCQEDNEEDTMATTFLDYRPMMAELHIDDLLREAAAARKVQAARAARRQRGV